MDRASTLEARSIDVEDVVAAVGAVELEVRERQHRRRVGGREADVGRVVLELSTPRGERIVVGLTRLATRVRRALAHEHVAVHQETMADDGIEEVDGVAGDEIGTFACGMRRYRCVSDRCHGA